MTRRRLRFLTCTFAVVAIGAGAWSLFAIRSASPSPVRSASVSSARAGINPADAPAPEALDSIGVERVPTAVARELSSVILAGISIAGLVALSWCTRRRRHVGVRSEVVIAAAPRGPPSVILA